MDNGDFSGPGSWNAYTYANGDPANLTDPTGLTSCGDAKITGGIFAGQTVSQVMTGTSGDDLLAQIIWHEGGTITATDFNSSAPVGSQLNNAYLLDLAALGTAVLNQRDVDNGRIKVYNQRGAAVCPLGQCLDRGLDEIIIDIA